MKKLTATNQRVQFYLTYTTEKPTTIATRKRMSAFRKSLESRGDMLDELFPAKQRDVLDRILYLTSGAGITKVGAEMLAIKCGVSPRTVTAAVRTLKATGEFIVGSLIKRQGGAGKYIFVDRKHVNFREIMREVFSLSDYKFAQLISEQIAEQKNDEPVEPVSVKGEKQSSNYDISFKSKQEKDNYISIVESLRQSVEEEQTEPTREYVVQYATNNRQIAFYDLLSDFPIHESIKQVRHVLALRIGSDCDDIRYVLAKDAILSIANRINDGYKFDNVVATFTGALTNAVNYKKVIAQEGKPARKTKAVPFYNWLVERE